jgi:Glycosyltransferases involved in cell wall biogenesis
MHKISIIVPVYNTEKYLHECIGSIVKQKFSDYELIMIDDGSTDNSLCICEEYARKYPNISVMQRGNGGAAAARNAGIRAATGRYLMFIDSDDYIREDCLTDIDKVIEESNADVIIGMFEVYCEDRYSKVRDCQLESQYIDGIIPGKVLQYLSGKEYLFTVWRHIVKRDLINKRDMYFYEGINYEDEEWCPRLLCAAESFSLLEKPFYRYRIRGGSVTSGNSCKDAIDRIKIALSLYSYSLKSQNVAHCNILQSRAYTILSMGFIQYSGLNENDKEAFFEYISFRAETVMSIMAINKQTLKFIRILGPFINILYPYMPKE